MDRKPALLLHSDGDARAGVENSCDPSQSGNSSWFGGGAEGALNCGAAAAAGPESGVQVHILLHEKPSGASVLRRLPLPLHF